MNAPQYATRHQYLEPDPPAGYRLAQLAVASAIASRDRCSIVPVVLQLFPNDAAAHAVGRTAAGAADSTTTAWASTLLREDSIAVMRDIAPLSAVARLATAGAQQLRFKDTASIVVPAVPWIAPDAEPCWVGEGGVVPVLQGVIAGERIVRRKLAGIISLTKELEQSSDAVETMRLLLRMGAASMLDRSVLDDSAAVAGVRPPGLLAGVVPITGSSAGGTVAMASDVSAVYAAMQTAGCGANVVFILNSGTAAALGCATNGTFGGLQVVGSPHVPVDTAIAVDVAYLAFGIDPIELEISGGTTLTMANADGTAPTQAMDNAGALGTPNEVLPDRGVHVAGGVRGAAAVGAQSLSMFQTWSLAIRLAWPVGYAPLMDGCVQMVSAITWVTPAP